jgi:cytoskeletal protein CcmA (bactofilin family)
MPLASPTIIGRPFAVWPATLQVMPEGILDVGFGRFFLGVRLSNGSTQAWPAAEVRISPRGRRILGTAAISIGDGWSSGDAAAVGQTAPSEWIPVPALAAGAFQTVFFKLDCGDATVGLHNLELEVRDPTVPATTLKVSAPLLVARTTLHGTQRTFTSASDRGSLSAALSGVTMDQELFRRVLGRIRAIAGTAAPGVRTPAETERLRLRLRALLCGEESDVCAVLADLNTSCALPTVPPPGPAPATGIGALAIFSDQGTTLADRVKIADGSVGSNKNVTVGNDAVINADVKSGQNVVLGDRTRVQGNVTAAGTIQLGAGTQVTGSQTEHGPFTSITIPTKTVTVGTTSITVNSGQGTTANPFVIAPGNYNAVTVNSNNVISLSAGVFQAATFIINADVTLIINQTNGVVDVRARDNLQFGDRTIVKITQPASGTLAPLFYSNQSTGEVRVGTDIATFLAAITVPNGTLHISSRTNMSGSLQGKNVNIDPDAGVARVPADDWLGTGSSGLEFLGYPTAFDYSVTYKDSFLGTTGPLAFGRVPWKALLANAMLLFDLGLPGAVAADLLAMADKAVVGTVKTSVLNAPTTAPSPPPPTSTAGSVDAAAIAVRGNRALGFPLFSFLDAQPGEPNATPVTALGGTISTPGTFMTNAEIDAAIAAAVSDPGGLKVYKVGAGTGVTYGLIQSIAPVTPRDDAGGTLQFVNQVLIVPDATAPAAGGKLAGAGDSGSLWIQTRSNKVVGMTHTVGSSGAAVVSRIQDVVNALQIQLA